MFNWPDLSFPYVVLSSKLGKASTMDLEYAIKMGEIKDWKLEADGDTG